MVFCKFKANDKISCYNFCLGSESKDFTKDEPAKFFWVVLFMFFHLIIVQLKKEDILDIHQYLTVKTKTK